LAVPAVQTVASGVLFRNGVMIKDGAALEKLNAIDTVIFDKTGTLTRGQLRLANAQDLPEDALSVAAGLAASSRHPLSRAICDAARLLAITPAVVTSIEEIPGSGLTGQYHGMQVKLGSRTWCGMLDDDSQGLPEFVLDWHSRAPMLFTFEDELRGDAAAVISELVASGIQVEILSGDREAVVSRTAERLGIERWLAGVTPQEKLAHITALKSSGRKVLMVGDGLNDAPALAAGLTSMAPSSASDVGRTAADTIFMGESLMPVLVARRVAVATHRVSIQNFTLAVGYNVLAVPLAMLGFASPLIAAIAMSSSSIIVIANSLRLGFMFRRASGKSSGLERVDRSGHFQVTPRFT
jgi:Cu2+-exporting ATPase